MKNAVIIGEYSRQGGGTKFLHDVYHSLENEYSIYLITDRKFRQNDLNFHSVINTSYEYYEGIPLYRLYPRVMRLKNELSDIVHGLSGDIVLNLHPNIFIYRGDVNYLHGFSFLDPLIDEYGNIKNKFLFLMIKYSGIFKIYNDARFLTHGKYTRDISMKMFPILGIKYGSIDYITLPVSIPRVELNLDRINDVLIFGRINRNKGIDDAIHIASRMPGKSFIIAGAVNEGDEDYVSSLEGMNMGNVKFIVNPSEEEKINLFRESSVYLHLNRKEHFGNTVAEAVWMGAIPVVPESGGPWIDIIEQGRYGFGYRDIDGAVDSIRQALDADSSFRRDVYISGERFSFPRFRDAFLSYLDDVLEG